MMNRDVKSERPWFILLYCDGVCMEGLRKTMTALNASRITFRYANPLHMSVF